METFLNGYRQHSQAILFNVILSLTAFEQHLHIAIIVLFRVIYNHIVLPQIKFCDIMSALHVKYFCPDIIFQVRQFDQSLLYDGLKKYLLLLSLVNDSYTLSYFRYRIYKMGCFVQRALHRRKLDCSCLQDLCVVVLNVNGHRNHAHSSCWGIAMSP